MSKNKTGKSNRTGGVAAPVAPGRIQAGGNPKARGRRARPQFTWTGFAQAHRDGLCMAALALISLAVFIHCLPYAFIDFDTDDFITSNPHVRNGLSFAAIGWAFSNFLSGYWTPLAWLTHQLDYQLYGPQTWGHHLGSLLFHAANAALFFLALRRMSGAFWRSAFVAAVFAVHPLHVESVVWIAERKDVLSAFFMILTLLAYDRFVRGAFTPKKYLLVAAMMILGLMSKPSVVTLPCLLLLLDYWPLRRWPAPAGESAPDQPRPARLPVLILEKAPLFVLSVIFSVLTYYAQDSQDITMKLPIGVRLGNATMNYLAYLEKTVWPFSLALLYPVSTKPTPLASLLPALLLLAGATLAAGLAWRRRPYLTAGWCWFLGLLVPMIGIIQVGVQSIADRYSYLSQSGLVIAFAWGAAELAGRLRISRRLVALAAALIILLLTARTIHQVTFWKDDLTLWEHTLKVTQNNTTAHLNYGYLLGQKVEALQRKTGKLDVAMLDEAIGHLEQSLTADATDLDVLTNLGLSYALKKDFTRAEAHFQRALKIKPDHYLVHYNLGMLARSRQDLAKAIAEFETAGRIAPKNPMPAMEIAKIWNGQGDATRAAAALRDAQARAQANDDRQMVRQIEGYLADLTAPPRIAPTPNAGKNGPNIITKQ